MICYWGLLQVQCPRVTIIMLNKDINDSYRLLGLWFLAPAVSVLRLPPLGSPGLRLLGLLGHHVHQAETPLRYCDGAGSLRSEHRENQPPTDVLAAVADGQCPSTNTHISPTTHTH